MIKHLVSGLFVFTLIGIVGVPSFVCAETPEEVLQTIVDKIKQNSNPSPVVDYVDWNEAFKNAPAEQKQAMRITSPQQMKQVYKKMLQNPAATMKEQLEQRLEEIPAEQRPMMQQSVASLERLMKEKEKEIKERIQETTYKIGEAVIEGNTARVKVSQTYKGETKQEEVKLVKSGDRWLLPSVGAMEGPPQQQPAGSMAPQ